MCFCGWVGVDTKVSRSAKPSIVAASIGAAQNRPPTDQPNFGSASSIVRLRTRMDHALHLVLGVDFGISPNSKSIWPMLLCPSLPCVLASYAPRFARAPRALSLSFGFPSPVSPVPVGLFSAPSGAHALAVLAGPFHLAFSSLVRLARSPCGAPRSLASKPLPFQFTFSLPFSFACLRPTASRTTRR